MKNDIEELKAYATKLRTDLTATNLVMLSIVSTLTPTQRLAVLKSIAEHSVMQEQTAERAQRPGVIAPLQASIQRLYSALEGVHKMQTGKTNG